MVTEYTFEIKIFAVISDFAFVAISKVATAPISC